MNTTFVDIDSLHPDRTEILSAMGIVNQDPDEVTEELLASALLEMKSVIKPQFNYRITDKISFNCGKIISTALQDAEKYAIVIATLGEKTDVWLKELMHENIAKMYVADILMSEIIEATMRQAIKEIKRAAGKDMNAGNSYSPGYCGWSLREQAKLFAFFEGSTCGITLNESCLMTPIKSISAVVPLGTGIKVQPYGCAICQKENCYKRKTKINHENERMEK